MRAIRFFTVILILGSLLSCGNLKGEFAFRNPGDKGFRVIHDQLEFDAHSGVKWLYRFKSVRSRVKLGVVILKKEIQWVDILTRGEYIDASRQIIYGDIRGFKPGDYKIVITEVTEEGSRLIDECTIYLYSDADEFD